MKIVSHSRSEIGTRSKNEDYVGRVQGFCTRAFVVCDGVGGSPAGEHASRGACETMLKLWKKNPALSVDKIATVFEETNRIMREIGKRDRALFGMRTTAAALFCRFGFVRCAHVGDSRVYLFRKNKVWMKTHDHVGRSEKLTRALGGADNYLPELSERVRVRRGDAFLICTDGFWKGVSDEQMEKTLRASKTPAEWVEKLLAIRSDTQDNYTVSVGFFG